ANVYFFASPPHVASVNKSRGIYHDSVNWPRHGVIDVKASFLIATSARPLVERATGEYDSSALLVLISQSNFAIASSPPLDLSNRALFNQSGSGIQIASVRHDCPL
ncbi:unnamed protein product, partial [Protopolystoma xenopodis]